MEANPQDYHSSSIRPLAFLVQFRAKMLPALDAASSNSLPPPPLRKMQDIPAWNIRVLIHDAATATTY